MMINVFFSYLAHHILFVEKFGTHKKDGIDIMNNIVCDLMKIVLIKVMLEKSERCVFWKEYVKFLVWRT